MISVRDRLRALQEQCGQSESATPTTTLVHGQELRSNLRRLLRCRLRCAPPSLVPPAGIEIAKGVQLVEHSIPNATGTSLVMPWGDAALVSREQVVCFDTETTGLAGGVGAKAFMIGSAQWKGGSLCIRQWYLNALSGEAAMLRLFSDSLPSSPIFVSYNGRSYDAPLLKCRYRIHRLTHPFDERRHVDLLYPTRRLYRGRWENCRLQTIEQRVLGIVRDDDLPGSEAPRAWLAFLRAQSSRNLARVVTHNQQDLVSLAILLNHLSDLSSEQPS